MTDIPWLVFGFITLFLNIAPLCWQIEHGNSAPACLGIWVIIANLNVVINGLVWRNDAIRRAPIWCDISVKLQIGIPFGILVSDICILMLLARVVGPTSKLLTQRDRRRRAFIDYALCFGFPVVMMAAHITYQPFRFGIVNNLGPRPPAVLCWPFWLCNLIWPPILSSAGVMLALYVAYRLVKHRREFKTLVQNSGSALTSSRYVRLGLLSAAFIFFNLPISFIIMIQQMKTASPYIPYDWSYIHKDLSKIDAAPWPTKAKIGDWTSIIAGLLVVVFFGFGSEAVSYYLKVFRLFGICHGGDKSDVGTKGVVASQGSYNGFAHNQTAALQQHVPSNSLTGKEIELSYEGPFNRTKSSFDMDLEDGLEVQRLQEAYISR